MFHIHRTSKAQALQNMTTVLPTPKSERLQQNLESDWTPGSYISQEEVSFDTPPQPDEPLMKINEGLEKNRKMLWEKEKQPLVEFDGDKVGESGRRRKNSVCEKSDRSL